MSGSRRGWPLVRLMVTLGAAAWAIDDCHVNTVGHTLEHIHE
jgi:hypothetical protein